MADQHFLRNGPR